MKKSPGNANDAGHSRLNNKRRDNNKPPKNKTKKFQSMGAYTNLHQFAPAVNNSHNANNMMPQPMYGNNMNFATNNFATSNIGSIPSSNGLGGGLPAPKKTGNSATNTDVLDEQYNSRIISGVDTTNLNQSDVPIILSLVGEKKNKQAAILRWYAALRVLTSVTVFFIVVGIIGALWISVDFSSVLGASYLAGTIMLCGGLLLGVWSDQNYATVRSYSIIRTIIDFLVILFEGSYFALQLRVVVSLCPAPPDPVSLYNCTNAYGLLIASVVYAGLSAILALILFIAEITLAYKVKDYARWKTLNDRKYGQALMHIVMRANDAASSSAIYYNNGNNINSVDTQQFTGASNLKEKLSDVDDENSEYTLNYEYDTEPGGDDFTSSRSEV